MANVLSDTKKQQILALGRLGWTLRRIEDATGVRRETASRYLKGAGINVREPGRWGHGRAKAAKETSTDTGSASKAASQTSTDSAPGPWPPQPPGRAPQASACEPYRELIEPEVAKGRDAMAIWQDLVDDHGFTHQYASVQRFVRKLRGTTGASEAHPVIVTAPGEEAQVDYGTGPMVRPAPGAKYQRTRLFVFTLGHSRKAVRLLTFRSSSETWARLHEQAFTRLGGVPRAMVLDNLGEGVLTPDIYDPAINPLYRDLLAHYGAVALPCRVRHADRKGKVESGVNHAQRKLKGLRFESLAEAQAYLDRWERRWADTRIHGTTKRQVAQMFAEERPHLLRLPTEPFRFYKYGKRTVHLDGYVEVERAYYAPPPGYIGQRLDVQWDQLRVRILDAKSGQLLREHIRHKPGGRRIEPGDEPKRTPLGTQALLARARRIGSNVGHLAEAIYRRDRQAGVRRIQGVIALARTYGAAGVDDACSAALEIGVAEYRFVRRYLERRSPEQLTLRQVDPLIRELSKYRDIINARTSGQEEP
jgi:transposase